MLAGAEADLAAHRVPGVVAPAWDGRSLGSVLPTVLHTLGARPRGTLLPPLRGLPPELLEGVERVVLLLLDGWGWRQLHQHLSGGWARLVQRGHAMPITSVSPATTTAALATLNTGVPPAEHGLLGYTLWLEEFGCIANMISFAPVVGGRGLDYWVTPEEFFRQPTAARLLGGAGHHLNITRREFLGSALTRMLYQDTESIGTSTLGELLVEVRNGLAAMRGDKGLLQAYWPSIDTVAHARGPASEHHAAEMALLGEALARELLDKVRDPAALLLVTADHGLVTAPGERVLRVRDQPDLADALLLPPWGDSRWAFLQAREGRREEVREGLRRRWGPQGVLLDTGEVERLGLLGPAPWPAATRRRVGDLVALPPPGHGITWPFTFDRPGKPAREELIGRHGGATPDEMIVPLLAVRF